MTTFPFQCIHLYMCMVLLYSFPFCDKLGVVDCCRKMMNGWYTFQHMKYTTFCMSLIWLLVYFAIFTRWCLILLGRFDCVFAALWRANNIHCALCDGWLHGRYPSLPWWRHQMVTFSALLALCVGNSPVTGEFPAQRPVTRNFEVFFDLRLNKRLSKQLWGWWFETPWPHSSWRHCNGIGRWNSPSVNPSTNQGRMTHARITKLGHHWFRFLWFNVTWTSETHFNENWIVCIFLWTYCAKTERGLGRRKLIIFIENTMNIHWVLFQGVNDVSPLVGPMVIW